MRQRRSRGSVGSVRMPAISDGWQMTIPDTETPSTYLVLAPGARLTDEDLASAKQTLAQLKAKANTVDRRFPGGRYPDVHN